MKKDNSVYLKHILDSIKRIEEYTKEISKEQFMSKNIVQAAAIREIEIIGEATKMIDNKFKEDYGSIPWKSIAGMRDKLIHGYFGVDLEAVWKTIEEDIPYLKRELTKVNP
ncbi:MAG: DUF86 domain-containing protein [Nanoarchaeota archaeon]|nr:DUF86 domain-containing protein [Nanoarchaeota archaeon]MBU1004595.1 DUF86 domain-containing protein [Nanoarchaeota archaeon]MBU1946979.1 DUF86 domain-containing protein [Nanoarchaeota archaeon]